jgi:hypothetical protein
MIKSLKGTSDSMCGFCAELFMQTFITSIPRRRRRRRCVSVCAHHHHFNILIIKVLAYEETFILSRV